MTESQNKLELIICLYGVDYLDNHKRPLGRPVIIHANPRLDKGDILSYAREIVRNETRELKTYDGKDGKEVDIEYVLGEPVPLPFGARLYPVQFYGTLQERTTKKRKTRKQ